MRIRLIAIGHRMPPWIDAGCEEYMKRLPREWNFELAAIRPATRSKETGGTAGSARASAVSAMQVEARAIEDALSPGTRRVVLDERGQASTSRELVDRIGRWQRDGRDVALIIGGADGLDPALKASADETLALSAMTLPHGIARVLLLEQLYRAASVIKGHPYHRD
jgi:23S rRNA (pseudouridine1915-N3)-methyltransferase